MAIHIDDLRPEEFWPLHYGRVPDTAVLCDVQGYAIGWVALEAWERLRDKPSPSPSPCSECGRDHDGTAVSFDATVCSIRCAAEKNALSVREAREKDYETREVQDARLSL